MNQKLFEYAFHSMLESGGDGNTLVLLKQQLVENVANEFADWAKKNWGTCEKKTTSDGVMFYDMQECVHFMQWKDFGKYQRNDGGDAPLSRGDYMFTDNIIITW